MFKAFLMSIMPFWRVELPPEAYNLGPEIQVIYYKNGSEDRTIKLIQSDPGYQQILHYLTQSKKVWKYDTTSYAPIILIRGSGITLNCFNRSSVVYFKDQNSNPIQLSSDPILAPNCGLKILEEHLKL